jgi:hypothetical protein
MTEISPFVKQQDLGSLTRLQEITKGTLAAIESKGLGHTEVRNEIQQWVLAFLYSRSFFERTMTARTNSYVTELFRLNESLYIDLGFRDHPVSTTTMILLRQLGALLVQVEAQVTEASIREKVVQVRKVLAPLIARASLGDSLNLESASVNVRKLTSELQDALQTMDHAEQIFALQMEINNLMEYWNSISKQ